MEGITGASVSAGRSLTMTLDLQGALFDAYHVLHVEASVEDMSYSHNDVVIPLTLGNLSKSDPGQRHVASMTGPK